MIAEEKAPQIVDCLYGALQTGIDEFTLRRLEGEAKALLNFDQTTARIALGLASALRKDKAGVGHHFHLATAASAGEAHVIAAWCGALQFIGAVEEAHSLVLEQIDKYPEDAEMAFYAMQVAIRLCRIREAIRYLDIARKFSPESRDINILRDLVACNVVEKLDRFGVTDDHLQAATVIFLKTLLDYRLMPRLVSVYPSDDPEDASLPLITYRVSMSGDSESIAEAICDTIVKLNSEEKIREDINTIIMHTVEYVDNS